METTSRKTTGHRASLQLGVEEGTIRHLRRVTQKKSDLYLEKTNNDPLGKQPRASKSGSKHAEPKGDFAGIAPDRKLEEGPSLNFQGKGKETHGTHPTGKSVTVSRKGCIQDKRNRPEIKSSEF